MNPSSHHTIAAIATPQGTGGIAIIRISGPGAWNLLTELFSFHSKSMEFKSHHAYHGWIMDGSEPLDEVLVTPFRAPNSYTGEDVIEISGHGSSFLSRRILNLILSRGIKPADPGEFTKRAFLNGRLDLSQAEAVSDLIHAQTEAARRVAAYQLEGRLSKKINNMRKTLIHHCGLLELELDFGEEDIEFTSRDELGKGFFSIRTALQELLASFQRGKVCREGIRLVIAGRPNVGKSSLLNRLIEKERAIVTDIPGTTRDTIEEQLDIEGVLFRITDTAGLRDEQNDPVEQEGIRRTYAAIDRADMILWVLDAGNAWQKEDEHISKYIHATGAPCICAINKCDLDGKLDESAVRSRMKNRPVLRVSALKGSGIRILIESLKSSALSGDIPHEGETIITRFRHAEALQSALDHIQNASLSLQDNQSQEFIAMDIRGALDALGAITGETSTDDILNHIFSEFCIGK